MDMMVSHRTSGQNHIQILSVQHQGDHCWSFSLGCTFSSRLSAEWLSTFHLHVILTAYDLLVQVTHGDSSISVPFLRMGTLIGLGQVPLVS